MAKRKKVTQRDPRGFELSTYEEVEEEDGVIKDGQSIRVPLYLMDGSPNPALDPVQRSLGKDAQINTLLVSDGGNDPLAMHRPGFRYSTNPQERIAADAALTDAYEQRERVDANAWQSRDEGDHPLLTSARGTSPGKKEGDACSINGQRGHLDDKLECVPDHADAQTVEDAYAEYDREAENAWRGQS